MNREAECFHTVGCLGQNGCSKNFVLTDHLGLRQDARCRNRQERLEYVAPFDGTEWERRERRYVAEALAHVPRRTSTLYWPCGRGRLLPLLKQSGYSVTCVDSSSRAISQARCHGGFLGENCIDGTDDFKAVDLLCAGFDDDHFGATIVNHLFCHFPEPDMRKKVLRELERICSGPIVVSFLRVTAPEKTVCQEHAEFRTQQVPNQVSVNRKSFAGEVHESGLLVHKWVPKHSLISKQTCAVLVRDKGTVRPSQLP